jgi:hypothetical protein
MVSAEKMMGALECWMSHHRTPLKSYPSRFCSLLNAAKMRWWQEKSNRMKRVPGGEIVLMDDL